jgi:sugar/nucleoside kinase (ribokinase family)
MKVTTFGGATQDIFLTLDSLDTISIKKANFHTTNFFCGFGEKIDIKSTFYTIGGGSTNSAVSFKKLSFNVNCFCKLGDDLEGKKIIDILKQENINTKDIAFSKEIETAKTTIISSLQEEEPILFCYRGSNTFLKEEDIPFDSIQESDLFYITSLSNNSAKLLPAITSHAKKHNVFVATNPGSSQLTHDVETLYQSLKNIDVLILNCSEAQKVMVSLINSGKDFKTDLRDFSQCKNNCNIKVASRDPYLIDNYILYENSYFNINAFCKAILRCGVKIIVITNGKNGVYVASDDTIYFCPSLTTKIVDTVGAGDSYGSAFVASLLQKFSIEDALKNGITNSASVLSYQGAKKGLLTIEELQQNVRKREKELVVTRFNL